MSALIFYTLKLAQFVLTIVYQLCNLTTVLHNYT